MAAIRVLVADDHAVVRQGLRTFLELQDDIEVVADVADGEQALAAIAEHRPDVVLMDLVLPVVDGHRVECLLPVGDVGHHLDVVLELEERPQALTDDGVVVSYEDANCRQAAPRA